MRIPANLPKDVRYTVKVVRDDSQDFSNPQDAFQNACEEAQTPGTRVSITAPGLSFVVSRSRKRNEQGLSVTWNGYSEAVPGVAVAGIGTASAVEMALENILRKQNSITAATAAAKQAK